MKMFNEKPISKIKQEQLENIPPSLLEVYEIVAIMGEEISALTEAKEALRKEVEALKGGAK
ncbi:hypothetical protein KUA25_06245 [Bacteroidales bacterium MSK.15.36]|nr:hypothetical protein [Bacteroidales bacterium MSK.15.36]